MINRRLFLKKAAGVALSMILSGCSPKNKTPIQYFENEIEPRLLKKELVRGIRKFDVPGADRCLIHILDFHFVRPPLSDLEEINRRLSYEMNTGDKDPKIESLRRKYEETNEFQEAVYKLIAEIRPQKIMLENVVEGTEGKQILTRYASTVETILRKLSVPKYNRAAGGAIYAFFDGKIQVMMAGGSERLYDTSGGLFVDRYLGLDNTPYDPDNAELAYHEQREDFVLSRLAEGRGFDNHGFAYVVFGAAHQFAHPEDHITRGTIGISRHPPLKDNLEAYNQKHPNDKLALIEILPAGPYPGDNLK